MVRSFDFKAHFFKSKYDLTAAVLTKVSRRKVKVTTLVIQFHSRVAFLVSLEQEEFWFWTYVHGSVA
ncbi:hypothetical protein D3C81_2290720 [compost metagenome]